MNDTSKTNQQLLEENVTLKQRIMELEQSQARYRQVEEELRFPQNQLQLLVDAGPDFFFLKDLDLRYELVNTANARFFGRAKADILGKTDMELMPEGAARACQESDLQAIREKKTVVTVEPVRDKVYETYKFPVIVADEIVGVAGIIRDITDRKRAEEELIKAEEKYRNIFENAVLGVFQSTPDGRFLGINNAFAKMHGYESAEEMISATANIARDRYIDPAYREKFKRTVEEQGTVTSFEAPYRRKDGSMVWLSLNARSVRDPHGRVRYYEGTVQDITGSRRAKEALEESEERYRTAIEHSSDGVAIVKGEEHIYVNRRFLAMFGYKEPEEFLCKGPYASVHPDDRERIMRINQERQREKLVPSRYEFKGIRKDGTAIYVEVSATRFVYQGEPATLAYLRDVTDRKRLESQLRQSQKMEAMGTLAGGIAHDFNNILAGIIGFTEMIRDDMAPDSPEYHRLGLVLKGAHRGRDLVKQILTFSRKVEYDQKPVALSGIVEDGLKLLRPLLPATIEIQWDGGTGDDIIRADSAQIHQVLMNLCTNSAQAMGRKGGVLKISVAGDHFRNDTLPPDMKPGDYVVLMLSDTGSGIKPEVLERIFDPFFTTKVKGEGTGLGLSVVHGIVKSHGGSIRVESEPGKGSVFSIFLPKIKRSVSYTSSEELTAEGGKECILFVDDEDILVELNNARLTQLGYEVVATTSSLEALAMFKKEPQRFHLVITDYTMPEMTGADLARKLLKVRSDIPIILCTGYNEKISPDKAKKVGIREFLLKPQGKSELDLAIRRVMNTKSV